MNTSPKDPTQEIPNGLPHEAVVVNDVRQKIALAFPPFVLPHTRVRMLMQVFAKGLQAVTTPPCLTATDTRDGICIDNSRNAIASHTKQNSAVSLRLAGTETPHSSFHAVYGAVSINRQQVARHEHLQAIPHSRGLRTTKRDIAFSARNGPLSCGGQLVATAFF